MTVLVVCCVLNDEESAGRWCSLLGTKRTQVLSFEQLEMLKIDNVDEEFRPSGIIVVGVEALKHISQVKSEDEIMEKIILEQIEAKGGHLTDSEMEELVSKLALQSLLRTGPEPESEEDGDFSDEFLPGYLKIIRDLIQDFHRKKKPVVGIGAGALQVCRALGVGDIEPLKDVRLRLDLVSFRSDAQNAGVIPQEEIGQKVWSVSRIGRSCIKNVRSNGTVLATSQLDDSAILIGIPPLDDSESISTFALTGCPEFNVESLIEYWLPLLDDHLLLSSTEAMSTLESIKSGQEYPGSGDVDIMNAWVDWVRKVLHVQGEGDEEETNELLLEETKQSEGDTEELMRMNKHYLETIRLLELKVDALTTENAELKAEVERLRLVAIADKQPSGSDQLSTASTNVPKIPREDLAIRALLLGIDIKSSPEQVARAESTIPRIVKENPFEIDGNQGLSTSTDASASVLAVCYTNEGDLLYTTTDKLIHAVPSSSLVSQQTTLDGPPVFIAVSPLSVPTEVAVGTLAGSIHRFTRGQDDVLGNHRVLSSKHKKHITGLVFDPTGTNKMASISRDGILVLWDSNGEPIATFGFKEENTPECCCSVMIGGEPFVAVAKRNDHRVALVPFAASNDSQAYFSLADHPLDDSVAFTPLVMAAFKDLPIIAVATDKSRVILYDVRNGGKKLREFWGHVCDEFARPVLSWIPSAKWLAVSSIPNKLFLFKVSQPNTPPVVLEDHSAAVRGIAFSAKFDEDGQEHHYLTTGSFDKKVKSREMRL